MRHYPRLRCSAFTCLIFKSVLSFSRRMYPVEREHGSLSLLHETENDLVFGDVAKGRFDLVKKPSFARLRGSMCYDPRIDTISRLSDEVYKRVDRFYGLEERFGDQIDLRNNKDLESMFRKAIVNAEQHGNQFDVSRSTRVRIAYDDAKATLRVLVRDEGEGFDWQNVVDAEKDARGTRKHYNFYRSQNDRPQGSRGYGLFDLIRYCSVRWNRRGNLICMERRLSDLA